MLIFQNVLEEHTMKLIYSLWLARYLIKQGFRCHGTIPHPYKPWMNAYQFEHTTDLEKAIDKYVEEGKKKL